MAVDPGLAAGILRAELPQLLAHGLAWEAVDGEASATAGGSARWI